MPLPGENRSETGNFPPQAFFLLLRLWRWTDLTLIPAERDVGATAVKVGVQKEWMDGSVGAGGLVFRDRPPRRGKFFSISPFGYPISDILQRALLN